MSFSLADKQKLATLAPVLQQKLLKLETIAFTQGYKIGIGYGYRTPQFQNNLYRIGRRGIKGEKIVTNLTGAQSKHSKNPSQAVDLVVYNRKGQITYNWKDFNFNLIGVWARQVGLTWGGNWAIKDYLHLEI